MSREVRVHYRHVRQANLCRGEVQKWVRSQGWSWIDFMQHGIPVSELSEFRNVFVDRVIDCALKEAEERADG